MKHYDRIQRTLARLAIANGTPEARALVSAVHDSGRPESAYMNTLLAAEDLRDGTRPFRKWDGRVTDRCRAHIAGIQA